LIEVMHRKAHGGFEAVCARRWNPDGETGLNKRVASVDYKVINRIANVEIPSNTGDFQLMSRGVIELLRHLRESHGFLRGFVALVGFKRAYVEYARAARFSGKGNHNRLFGSLTSGLNGAFGFSNRPLGLWLMDGPAIAGLSFASAIVMAFLKLSSSLNYPMRIPTVTVLVLLIGDVQLISVSFLVECIGRIYDEVKPRTTHLIDEAVNVTVRSRRSPGNCSL
jgi:polyisoprenyl-phosphate glycosyltransferase